MYNEEAMDVDKSDNEMKMNKECRRKLKNKRKHAKGEAAEARRALKRKFMEEPAQSTSQKPNLVEEAPAQFRKRQLKRKLEELAESEFSPLKPKVENEELGQLDQVLEPRQRSRSCSSDSCSSVAEFRAIAGLSQSDGELEEPERPWCPSTHSCTPRHVRLMNHLLDVVSAEYEANNSPSSSSSAPSANVSSNSNLFNPEQTPDSVSDIVIETLAL